MKYDFDQILDRRGTGSLKWDYAERVLGIKDVIPMWVADMDFPAPQPVIDAMRARADHGAYGYPLTPASYWTAIQSWMKTRFNWDVKKEWLSKSPGVVPALSLCVTAFSHPGDKIVVQTPVYYPFYSAVKHNGRRIVRNPLKLENGRFVMDFEDLERKIDPRTRLLILCSPHNPVGRVWRVEELVRLAEICFQKDLLIVSDEIHADLVLPGARHFPLAALSEEIARRTITLAAPSKTFNIAGLATAVVIASNPRILNLFNIEAANAGLSMGNVFGIVALESAYTQGADWLDQLLPYLAENVATVQSFLEARVPRIKLIRPEGTFLALLDCRELGLDLKAIYDFFLRKAGVYFDDGILFGEELAGFVRMNFATPRSVLIQALERIERAVAGLGS
jgi:cystathionine beta-lyase